MAAVPPQLLLLHAHMQLHCGRGVCACLLGMSWLTWRTGIRCWRGGAQAERLAKTQKDRLRELEMGGLVDVSDEHAVFIVIGSRGGQGGEGWATRRRGQGRRVVAALHHCDRLRSLPARTPAPPAACPRPAGNHYVIDINDEKRTCTCLDHRFRWARRGHMRPKPPGTRFHPATRHPPPPCHPAPASTLPACSLMCALTPLPPVLQAPRLQAHPPHPGAAGHSGDASAVAAGGSATAVTCCAARHEAARGAARVGIQSGQHVTNPLQAPCAVRA